MSAHVVVVIPVYNEGEVLIESIRLIAAEARGAGEATNTTINLLVVDDGSDDGTPARLGQAFRLGNDIQYLRFTRNYGKEAAILAGLEAAQGADAVVVMDADLQHPPELLRPMLTAWHDGAPVVEACKARRGDEQAGRTWGAHFFYWLFRRGTGLDLDRQSDFKLLDAEVVQSYLALPERGRFFRGLVDWLHYPSIRLEFDVPVGVRPGSRWRFAGLARYAVESLVSFTAAPLQLVTWCGGMTFMVSLVFGGKALFDKLAGRAVDGFSTVILLLLLIGSVLMFSLGLIGLYLAKIYDEVKRRPLYQIDRRHSHCQWLKPR